MPRSCWMAECTCFLVAVTQEVLHVDLPSHVCSWWLNTFLMKYNLSEWQHWYHCSAWAMRRGSQSTCMPILTRCRATDRRQPKACLPKFVCVPLCLYYLEFCMMDSVTREEKVDISRDFMSRFTDCIYIYRDLCLKDSICIAQNTSIEWSYGVPPILPKNLASHAQIIVAVAI
jgi:hypothetical protein